MGDRCRPDTRKIRATRPASGYPDNPTAAPNSLDGQSGVFQRQKPPLTEHADLRTDVFYRIVRKSIPCATFLRVRSRRRRSGSARRPSRPPARSFRPRGLRGPRSEEHTSELQSLRRISYAVFCLKKKKKKTHIDQPQNSCIQKK